jgi:protein TonB
MFDLIASGRRHPFHEPTVAPTVVSVIGHGVVVLAVAGASFLAVGNQLPAVPDMMAFVADAPAPPAPPPPPPARRATPAKPQPLPLDSRSAAPIEAPSAIVAEAFVPSSEDDEGVEGGVEGGIVGGVPGGVVGGLLTLPAPPPPPQAPAPARHAPVRIGGQISSPALVHRVNPEYPEVAMRAQVTGLVILEATVDAEGKVESVRVLRSVNLLDRAAIEAVKQWRYSPLVLNGIPEPFILTVTLIFSLPPPGK